MAALIAAGIFIYTLMDVGYPYDDEAFDEDLWKVHHTDFIKRNPRGLMAEAVQTDVLRPGMRRAEIMEKLGPPDLADEVDMLSYNLGAWSDANQGFDSLNIHLSEDGTMIRSEIIRH